MNNEAMRWFWVSIMSENADDENAQLKAELERLRAEVTAWRECARYDPNMSGRALFKGWDRSALDRCRKKYEDQSGSSSALVKVHYNEMPDN